MSTTKSTKHSKCDDCPHSPKAPKPDSKSEPEPGYRMCDEWGRNLDDPEIVNSSKQCDDECPNYWKCIYVGSPGKDRYDKIFEELYGKKE